MNKKNIALAAGLALAALSTSAMAEGQGFVRVEGGHGTTHFVVPGVVDGSDGDNAWSLRGGYWLNSNVALEGFYTRAYDKSETVDGVRANLKANAFGVGVAVKKHFNGDTGFYAGGRIGAARAKAEASATGYGSASSTSVKPYIGVGVGYDINRNFGVSLNWDRLRGNDTDSQFTSKIYTVGFEYRF